MAETSPDDESPCLASLWAARLTQGTSVPFTGLRDIMRILKHQGFEMPSEKAFVQDFRPAEGWRCEFKDLMRMVWDPLVAFMDTAATGDGAQLTEALEQNIKAIELELAGLVSGSLDAITIDEWLKAVQQHIQRFVGCRVSTEHIESITGSLVPFKMEASSATAFIF